MLTFDDETAANEVPEHRSAELTRPLRLSRVAIVSAVVVTGSIAGLGSYSNAKYADAYVAAHGHAVTQTTQAAIAPLKVDVVGRRVAA